MMELTQEVAKKLKAWLLIFLPLVGFSVWIGVPADFFLLRVITLVVLMGLNTIVLITLLARISSRGARTLGACLLFGTLVYQPVLYTVFGRPSSPEDVFRFMVGFILVTAMINTVLYLTKTKLSNRQQGHQR
ncbi:MAG: hypothetical protein ACJ741_08195 [Pyrinomonadaceae bacterium]